MQVADSDHVGFRGGDVAEAFFCGLLQFQGFGKIDRRRAAVSESVGFSHRPP